MRHMEDEILGGWKVHYTNFVNWSVDAKILVRIVVIKTDDKDILFHDDSVHKRISL